MDGRSISVFQMRYPKLATHIHITKSPSTSSPPTPANSVRVSTPQRTYATVVKIQMAKLLQELRNGNVRRRAQVAAVRIGLVGFVGAVVKTERGGKGF